MRRAAAALLAVLVTAGAAGAVEPVPLQVRNEAPTVAGIGIGGPREGALVASGRGVVSFAVEAENSHVREIRGSNYLLMDSETWRYTLEYRRRIGEKLEAGVAVPVVAVGGGVLDPFIETWHHTFGLPRGDRESAPRGESRLAYVRDGRRVTNRTGSSTGFGDILVTGAVGLREGGDGSAASLRATLKIPTASRQVFGTGSTDLALYLSGTEKMGESLRFFWNAGGVAMTEGDLLPSQRHLAAFGGAGLGWAPFDSLSFTLQADGTTPFYGGSPFKEITGHTLLLTMGGTARLAGGTFLDVGVGEDVAVDTAPDLSLHLRIRREL